MYEPKYHNCKLKKLFESIGNNSLIRNAIIVVIRIAKTIFFEFIFCIFMKLGIHFLIKTYIKQKIKSVWTNHIGPVEPSHQKTCVI